MASSNVSKLRFMAKARESSHDQHLSIEGSSASDEKWTLSVFNSDRVQLTQGTSRALTTISSMPRRSYGGANPFIEQLMSSTGRNKKQKTK